MYHQPYQTAFMARYDDNPYRKGFIVCRRQNCGKKNCRCYKSNDFKHKAFYLKYWDYDQKTEKSKQRTIYLKKSQVSIVQKQLAAYKGMMLLYKRGDSAIFTVANLYPNLAGKDLHIQAYLLYGNSKNAERWLNYQN